MKHHIEPVDIGNNPQHMFYMVKQGDTNHIECLYMDISALNIT